MKNELFRTINKPQFPYKFKTIFRMFYKSEFLLFACLHELLKTVKIVEWNKSQYSTSNSGTSDI